MSERAALVTLCTKLALPTVGSLSALRKRASDALLTKALVDLEKSAPSPEPPAKKPRRANPWLEFVKEEKPRLLAEGWKKGTVLTELRRLWHEKKDKASDTDTMPLLLTYVSDSIEDSSENAEDTEEEEEEEASMDKLIEALYQWPVTSLSAELALHGHPISGSKSELVSRLATAMLGA